MPEGTNIDGSLNYSITANYGSITVLWHVSVNESRIISKV